MENSLDQSNEGQEWERSMNHDGAVKRVTDTHVLCIVTRR